MKPFTKEFLIATAAHALFLAWFFRGPLLHGQVDSVQEHPIAVPQALVNMSEMVYEVLPAIAVQTREIKDGIFPGWSPYSQGGTPLIGKMQNGVFAPYHLLLYALPIGWMPFLFTLIIAMKSYLTFIFTYLFVRSLRLNLWTGILAGTLYVLPAIMGGIFSWFGPGLYLPLLLLLVECYFQNHRKLARFLWPWAVALPFFSGHFETAFWINFFAGIYFLLHLRADSSAAFSFKFRNFLGIAGLSLAGAVIAAVQIYPAFEYVNLSYNRIWHLFDWFGWEYNSISKHLSPEDVPMIALGLAGLGAFYAAFKRCLAAKEEWSSKTVALKLMACASLAWTIACFANLGLDDSLSLFDFSGDPGSFICWLLGLYLIAYACWTWRQENQPRGLAILGQIMMGGALIGCKMPLVSNFLIHLPVVQHFHNGINHRFEYDLAVSVLGAASLERFAALPSAWADRVKTALRIFGIACIFAFGYVLSQPLKGILATLVPTGTPPPITGRPAPPGGVMGPERVRTFNQSYTVAGWAPSFPPPSAIGVSVFLEGQNSGQPLETVRAEVEPSGGKIYFHAAIPLTETLRKSGALRIVAQVQYGNGASQYLTGPLLEASARGGGPAWSYFLLIAFLSLPAVFLLGPLLRKGVYLLIFVLSVFPYQSTPISANEIPYPLPGIGRIKQDHDTFRISGMQYTFLQADNANMYGVSDLRTGGDNLDLLTMIYFDQLSRGLMGNAQDPAAFDLGLRLWGLGNAKYIIDLPDADLSKAGLEMFYRGPDMSVWKNKYFTPRAAFYDRYAYLPVKDWEDWNNRGQFLMPLVQLIGRKNFDWNHTLILNDMPSGSFPANAGGMEGRDGGDAVPASSVHIDQYRPDRVGLAVDAAKPGFLFLSDNNFPGWEAFVNGKKSPILHSWITFRAVEVPAGKSKVEFIYRPVVLWLILLLAACAGVMWAFLYWKYRLTRPSLEVASAPPQNPKKKKGPALVEDNSRDLIDSALMAEKLFFPCIGATLLFWLVWSAFVYSGGPLISWAARVLLAGFILLFARDLWALRRAMPQALRLTTKNQ